MVARKTAPEGFDIIIDDASHFGDLTKIAFWHLFDNHLKPSGLYVIEDWGTGYWSDWTDGKAYRPRYFLFKALSVSEPVNEMRHARLRNQTTKSSLS